VLWLVELLTDVTHTQAPIVEIDLDGFKAIGESWRLFLDIAGLLMEDIQMGFLAGARSTR